MDNNTDSGTGGRADFSPPQRVILAPRVDPAPAADRLNSDGKWIVPEGAPLQCAGCAPQCRPHIFPLLINALRRTTMVLRSIAMHQTGNNNFNIALLKFVF